MNDHLSIVRQRFGTQYSALRVIINDYGLAEERSG